ncbi:TAXI family TRAP transporter solute-binding subunit [Dongia rigui]|uniref:TAXI family TRAP transporter solute-binding subunit n=1 Tax=Dongia rigui TaxID=940149 RepID=A0ABU5E4A1_9PROT|nr:TAXI family TRAP transporter solute-binding subunit [Dongia rigui]MDY0874132.1 TAXI family TRAP transporter solute-binding subunit [Dongia rigui]
MISSDRLRADLVSRRRVLFGLGGAACAAGAIGFGLPLLSAPVRTSAQELSYFRVGAGAPGTPIYELAGLIGGAISNPPGTRSCDEGGSCGIPGMIGLAQTSSGSVENLGQLRSKLVESAVAQADIAYLAYSGKDIFKTPGKDAGLRAICGLGRLNVKIIVGPQSAAKDVPALKGLRVNLGGENSDNAVTARQILGFHGLSTKRVKPSYLDFPAASEALAAGKIDAMIVVDALDSRDVTNLANSMPVRFLPITGEAVNKMMKSYGFIASGVIKANTFRNIPDTPTVELVAVWLVPSTLDAEIAYELTRAVWLEATRKNLDQVSAAGKALDLQLAIAGVSVPFHAGALKYYDEHGVTRFLPAALRADPAIKTN